VARNDIFSSVDLMSTDGDRNISGNPDVYEHNNSSPHSGRSRGGRFPSNSSSRGRGKSGGRSGGRRGGTSKDEHQVRSVYSVYLNFIADNPDENSFCPTRRACWNI
jgi:hypothetical protein